MPNPRRAPSRWRTAAAARPGARPRSIQRGRVRLLAGFACAAAVSIMALFGTAHADTTISTSQIGTSGAYFYSFWTADSAPVSMTLGAGGDYSTAWNNVGNFVAGVGWSTGGRNAPSADSLAASTAPAQIDVAASRSSSPSSPWWPLLSLPLLPAALWAVMHRRRQTRRRGETHS